MTLEAQKIKFSNMEISNSGSNLLFNATQNINISGTAINAPNENIVLDGNLIYNCNQISSLSGTAVTIEALGTGNILFKTPSTAATPIMQIKNDGITYFDVIPTTAAGATTSNDILKWNTFETQTTFTPTISTDTVPATLPTYSSQIGYYTKVGNLVFFTAIIGVSSLGTLVATQDVRISIPISVNYTSLNMPQPLTIISFENIIVTATDHSCAIGGDGITSPLTSVNYAKLYYKPTNTSASALTVKIGDITTPFFIRYSGVYYSF